MIFTWFNRQCYLLLSCEEAQTCPCCVSGPGTGAEPDVDTCDVPCTDPSQSTTPTPTPVSSSTTTTTITTTEAPSTPSTSCDDFFMDQNLVCSTAEANILEHIEDIEEAFHNYYHHHH